MVPASAEEAPGSRFGPVPPHRHRLSADRRRSVPTRLTKDARETATLEAVDTGNCGHRCAPSIELVVRDLSKNHPMTAPTSAATRSRSPGRTPLFWTQLPLHRRLHGRRGWSRGARCLVGFVNRAAGCRGHRPKRLPGRVRPLGHRSGTRWCGRATYSER